METIHADGTPLAAYFEGKAHTRSVRCPLNSEPRTLTLIAGEGYLEPIINDNNEETYSRGTPDHQTPIISFAPSNNPALLFQPRKSFPKPIQSASNVRNAVSRVHNAWSTAVNSRLRRADNARFIEHFRYIIVASQLLNEYLDQGSLPPPAVPGQALDGAADNPGIPSVTTSLYGAAASAVVAFALVYLLHWARSSRSGIVSKSRVALVLLVLIVITSVGYAYVRRQWLKFLRRHAVAEVTTLTANWQAFEVSTSSALSLIQEVELVSKGYRLSTPLPPASRIEDQSASRRCGRLRKSLHKAYTAVIPHCIDVCSFVRTLIEEDDLDKYFEVYDINAQDAEEAARPDALNVLEDDAESLKSLRVLSYRAGVLRRVTLCSFMGLEADGSKLDFQRWHSANETMTNLSKVLGTCAENLQQCLSEMETLPTPVTSVSKSPLPAREKMRSQVRKISMLSSGIRGLQAKMQILREETSRAIEKTEDLTDLGPSLVAQYESIGADLRELMQAWEAGKVTLQSNINKHERRMSLASSSMRSPVSSIGGLTAVEEGGGPADALKALTGDSLSSRSSMATTPSDDEVFEAVAMPRQRSTFTREERIMKMHEERERQASLRAKRDANTSMLRELESVINLRPKKVNGDARITSI